MSRTRWNVALALVVILAITGWLPTGCQMPGGGGTSKKGGGALSEKEVKAAGKTIKTALLKNAGKGKPAAGDAKSQPDRDARAPIPKIPEMNYAAADTAKLAAIMDDIQLTPEPYYYASVGRRDLFAALLTGESKAPEDDSELSSRDLRVVGILWAERDRFALVEGPDKRSRILREGDTLGDGIVTRVMPDKVIIHVTEYGSSRTVTMPLVQGGGSDESPRSRGR
jgi:hypothetical protein